MPLDARPSAAAAIVQAARTLEARGLNAGTSGNVSVRDGADMLITPSAVPPGQMQPGQVVRVSLATGTAEAGKPSSEWPFHQAILQARPDVGAVVHTHAPYCTALAIARRPIPAVHYMVALFGGTDVRCAPYALFGSAALAAHTVAALEGRHACLLANHGMVAVGPDLGRALWHATELEVLAQQYCLSLAAGTPALLDDAAMAEAAQAFRSYRPSP